MLIVLIGLLLGIFIGLNVPFIFGGAYTIYVSVGILAAIDSIFGAIRSGMDNRFNSLIFVSGFITNALVAGGLAFVGDRLGLPLYYAAMFVFGSRLFNNIAVIRRHVISKYTKEKF